MMTTLLAACILASDSIGVSNVVDTGPQAQHNAVRDVAAMIKTPLFAPDKTARGYSLKTIEFVNLKSGQFGGLDQRPAVRMRFVNKNTATAFDIYQVPSSAKTDANKHMRWLIGQGVFEGGVSTHDTFVSIKRGNHDLAFVGGLVSEPSAKELLTRLVKITP